MQWATDLGIAKTCFCLKFLKVQKITMGVGKSSTLANTCPLKTWASLLIIVIQSVPQKWQINLAIPG